jgi:lauroyl/myristoyl acyltransferase
MLRTGAPVFPVFTVREEPGRFRTVIEPPLEARADAGREQVAQDLVAAVTARIEHYARCWPDQFSWRDFVTGRDPSAE